ncbi:hypothetical protein [Oceanivirga salmonicida]|uniref:hypothetical protein n=1 Tax=Oceanivirga salmonicida TaxID=1769291 RepID=UPI00083100DC|nr:hypothetical protein [Oceanivirga salmonicida]
MKINFKYFDFPKNYILKACLLLLILLPIIKNNVLVYALLLLFLLVFNTVIAYLVLSFTLDFKIEFLENELHLIKGKRSLKLKYRDIKMVKISNNIFGTKNISLNYRPRETGFIFWVIFSDLINFGYIVDVIMANAITLPNVINHDEILEKLSEKINIDFKEKCTTKISYKYSIKEYLAQMRLYLYFTVIMSIIDFINLNLFIVIPIYILFSIRFLKNNNYLANIGNEILKVVSKNEIYFFINNFEIIDNEIDITIYKGIVNSKIPIKNSRFVIDGNIARILKIEH